MNFINQIIILMNLIFFVAGLYYQPLFISGIYCPFYIVQFKNYISMILHAFMHVNIGHLCMNMLGFIRILENPIISRLNMFRFLILYFFIFNILYLSSSIILFYYFNYPALFFSRSVGFSGVLFALRYLTSFSYDRDAYVNAYGFINVQQKYLIFIDLIVTKILLPGSSFWGHLCGILTGYSIKYLNL